MASTRETSNIARDARRTDPLEVSISKREEHASKRPTTRWGPNRPRAQAAANTAAAACNCEGSARLACRPIARPRYGHGARAASAPTAAGRHARVPPPGPLAPTGDRRTRRTVAPAEPSPHTTAALCARGARFRLVCVVAAAIRLSATCHRRFPHRHRRVYHQQPWRTVCISSRLGTAAAGTGTLPHTAARMREPPPRARPLGAHKAFHAAGRACLGTR